MHEQISAREKSIVSIVLPSGRMEISFNNERGCRTVRLSKIVFISPKGEAISLDVFLGRDLPVHILSINNPRIAMALSMVWLNPKSSEVEIQLGSLTAVHHIGILLHELGHVIQLNEPIFSELTEIRKRFSDLDTQNGTLDDYFSVAQELSAFYPSIIPEIERSQAFAEDEVYKGIDRRAEERQLLSFLQDEGAFEAKQKNITDELDDVKYDLEEAEEDTNIIVDLITRQNMKVKLEYLQQQLDALKEEESILHERRSSLEPAFQRRNAVLGGRDSELSIPSNNQKPLTIRQLRWIGLPFLERDATYRALHIMRLLRDQYDIIIDDEEGSVEKFLTKTALASYKATTADITGCVSVTPSPITDR